MWIILKQFGKRWWKGEILSLEAVVYHIWKHRNDVRHSNNVLKSNEQILKIISWEIRTLLLWGLESSIGLKLIRSFAGDGAAEIKYFVSRITLFWTELQCLVLLFAKFRKVVGIVGCVAFLAAESRLISLHYIVVALFGFIKWSLLKK
jgi:hypothetical protein